jgi:hypothetical protein
MRRIVAYLSKGFAVFVTAAALSATSGCTVTPREYWEALKGEGFPGWSDSGLRGDTKDVKPSGFFTDRRSEQIEKSLGGGF